MIKITLPLLLLSILCLETNCLKAQETNLTWPTTSIESKPFTRWWWMGSAVDSTNLTYNLEALQKAGFGGVEITPIYGVTGNEHQEIAFLSPAWIKMLKHTIVEANRLGMNVDMNTGTGWPFGGPQITIPNAAGKFFFEYYAVSGGQNLSEKIILKNAKQKNVALFSCLMAYSAEGEKINLTEKVKPDGTLNWTAPKGNWKLFALFSGKTLQSVKRSAPGGEGLVLDHFSKTAVDAYLRPFTEAFLKSGSPRPLTFFNDSYEVYDADWTSSFLDEFRKRRNYNLENFFPELLGEGKTESIARVKSDYRETMSDMLVDNFTKQWTNWAHSMGSINRNQAHGSPGNLIDIYGIPDIPECETFGATLFDIPGLSILPQDIRHGDTDPMMLKFASSSGHIAGRKYISSETFTWLREHFKVTLAQCKPEVDQLFLSGINHVFFHGTTYSPKEAIWPGWLFYASCEFSPNNSIWHDINGLTSYIQRCQSFLQSGQSDSDVLVYWPVYDIWNNPNGMDMPFKIHDRSKWLENSPFYSTIQWLRKSGYDFDYISDNFLEKATVENGMVKISDNHYKIIIIPTCTFMPLKTLQRIESLSRDGAKIIFEESLPKDVPGLSNLELNRGQLAKTKESLHVISTLSKDQHKSLAKGQVIVSKLSTELLTTLGVRYEDIVKENVSFVRRKYDLGNVYFFANQQSKALDGWVKLSVNARSAAIFDPLTGKSGLARIRKGTEGTEVYLQLASDESLILKTWTDINNDGNQWDYYQPAANPTVLNGTWNLTMTQGYPAVHQEYTMDTLKYWTSLGNPDLNIFAGTGKYSLKFTLPATTADNWRLNLGRVCESAHVKINGNDAGIWWSIPFSSNIGQYLKKGENLLEIEVTNLSANRLSDMDKRKEQWRIFREINFVDLNYKPFDASNWKMMDSGLIGPVTLTALNK